MKETIVALWSEYSNSHPILKRGFCHHEFEKRDVLFMGINPSYVEQDKEERIDFVFCLQNEESPNELAYYKHYYRYATVLGIKREEWTYQDLFFFRETNHKKLWDLGTDFILAHLRISKTIIETIVRPKFIIICNAFASHFFGIEATDDRKNGVWLGYIFEFDENLGCHKIVACKSDIGYENSTSNDTDLIGTYIYFTSFNQYKSHFDKERMDWHIKMIWENIKNR